MFYYTLIGKNAFASSLTASNTKRANLTWLPSETVHRGHTWHDYPWPWVPLTWLLYNLQLDNVTGVYFENSAPNWWSIMTYPVSSTPRRRRKFTGCSWPIKKEIVSSMYNNSGYSCLPGCCCIDEFDKMGSQHQALLEAMVHCNFTISC